MASASARLPGRRDFCLCCLAAAGGWLLPRKGLAAGSPVQTIKAAAAAAPIEVHRVRGNVAILEGSGGNIAVLCGTDGKLLVDAGISGSRPQLMTALMDLGPEPMVRLINTHWHFDHADGNAWVHEQGAAILAHANTRRHLDSTQRVDDWNFDFPVAPPAALPSEVFTGTRSLRHGGATLRLASYAPAHTDGDISVTFVEADILHTGDTFWNGVHPFIDYSTGGSIDGMIRAADANLAATTDKTIVIPGHGQPVSNRAGLQDYRDMLVAIRDNVATLKHQGRSLDETIAARPTAAFDAKWGNFVIDPGFITKLVYHGA